MKNRLLFLFYLVCIHTFVLSAQSSWIRINQLGYLPQSTKVAVYLSLEDGKDTCFILRDKITDKEVFRGGITLCNGKRWGMKEAIRLNFSNFTNEGRYYLEYNGIHSPEFTINTKVYNNTADYLLQYMRQQRCGFNPYLDTLCHQHDGYIVDHPTLEGKEIDVRGGWHDASDYLQYLPTSANATFQMLFAWQQTPDKSIFKDEFDALGKKGNNGIPDILDEVRWGLDWMVKMNPENELYFNQIADDRDHAGFRMPSQDKVDYGWGAGLGRPVYPVTGKPQGLREDNRNRSTGVASSVAKFASAFALGAELFKDIDPLFSVQIKAKALEAYNFGKKHPGNNQTACTVSPYFYEEDNWVDDMELAAAVQYNLEKVGSWMKDADYWGQLEEITPWMELGRARHYQYYPFVNLGHYYLASGEDEDVTMKYTNYMKMGLSALYDRAKKENDPFINGIPFIWCSNNLLAAAITQAKLYHQVSKDTSFDEMEASLRDWLFGCNPWGTSMIVGLPENGDSPTKVHAAYTVLNGDITFGGLVDGPIYKRLYENLRGIHLTGEDIYAPFQNGVAVYHDDPGDYSSNEPTMDGTASLTFYLSSMEKEGKSQKKDQVDSRGATVRKNKDKKEVRLIFSADTRMEGAEHILEVLKKYQIKASFFLTGNALRNKEFDQVIRHMIKDGHYLGAHSDKHILYASWDNASTLVSKDSLIRDLENNMEVLNRWGISKEKAQYYLPPYEWYNEENVKLISAYGMQVINFTPGIRTAADYTTPDMKNYKSSQELMDLLYLAEKENGLDGTIILIHPGTEPARTDKLYNRLDEIILTLKNKGYHFERF